MRDHHNNDDDHQHVVDHYDDVRARANVMSS